MSGIDLGCLKAGAGIVLLRHGETTGESSIRFHGKTDVPLSELGRTQVGAVASLLREVRLARIYCSSLSRSRESAEILAAGEGTPILIDDRLDEIDFGLFEGLTRSEIAERFPDDERRWRLHKSEFAFPGGESRGDFRDRVRSAIQGILGTEGAFSEDAPIAFAVHKGVLVEILSHCLGFPSADVWKLELDLGSLSALIHREGSWRLGFQNLVPVLRR